MIVEIRRRNGNATLDKEEHEVTDEHANDIMKLLIFCEYKRNETPTQIFF